VNSEFKINCSATINKFRLGSYLSLQLEMRGRIVNLYTIKYLPYGDNLVKIRPVNFERGLCQRMVKQVLPKVIWEELRRKVPLVTMGRLAPNSTRKLPLPFDDNHFHLIHPSSTDPTHHPKQHRDPISRLPQYTFRTDRQTDRPTDTHRPIHVDGLGDRSVR